MITSRSEFSRRPRIRAADLAGWGSLLTVNLTVMLMPWLLGGTIPLSRFVLQVGAVTAIVLNGIATIPRTARPAGIPRLLLPLLGLGCLAILHLLPVFPDPLSEMDHAVHAEARSAVPVGEGYRFSRSLSPGDTRHALALYAALAAVLIVASDQLTTRARLSATLSLQTANAAVVAAVALVQKFGNGEIIIGGQWIRSQARPFAAFVNPNHAAGWLLAQLAFAVALWLLITRRHAPRQVGDSRRRLTPPERLRRVWEAIWFQLATMTAQRISVVVAITVVTAGVAATLSRGGILAGILSIAITVAVRMGRQPFRLLLSFAGLGVFATGLLMILRVDSAVSAELATLADPITEGAGRLRHWRDSIVMLLDFPVLGCGIGTYQFATLPYQSIDAGAWFRHADNQYVELLVEAGLIGLMVLTVALWQVVRLLRDVHRVSNGESTPTGTARCLFPWLLLLVLGQLLCACFDFGIALCATSSLMALALGGIPAAAAGLRGRRDATAEIGIWKTGGGSATAIRFTALVVAAVFLPDLWHSCRIYQSVIAGSRIEAEPTYRRLQDELPEVRKQLELGLQQRPDDSEGLLMRAWLAESAFRFALLQRIPDAQDLDVDTFRRAWQRTSLPQFAAQLVALRSTSPSGYVGATATARAELRLSGLRPAQERVLTELRLVPLINAHRAYLSVIVGEVADFPTLARQAVFPVPGSATSLFNLGQLLLQLGEPDEAVRFWNATIVADPSFRPAILLGAVDSFRTARALQLFGPDTWEDAVACLQASRAGELRERLIELADAMWPQHQSEDVSLRRWRLRDGHLTVAGRSGEALEWATQQIQAGLNEVQVRVRRAELLEQHGHLRPALQEWRLVQSMLPDGSEADGEVQRLSALIDQQD